MIELRVEHNDNAQCTEILASCSKCGWVNSQPVLMITDLAAASMAIGSAIDSVESCRRRVEDHHRERCAP